MYSKIGLQRLKRCHMGALHRTKIRKRDYSCELNITVCLEPLKSNKMGNNSPKHHCNKANHEDPPIILAHKITSLLLGRDGKPLSTEIQSTGLSYKNQKGQDINEVIHSSGVENTHQ